MTLEEIVQKLGLEVRAPLQAPGLRLAVDVTGGYACDLLSYVMARAKEGYLWLTVQGHPNIVAVASLINLAGIVVTDGSKVEPATIERAEQEGIPLLVTDKSSYLLAGELYELGVGLAR